MFDYWSYIVRITCYDVAAVRDADSTKSGKMATNLTWKRRKSQGIQCYKKWKHCFTALQFDQFSDAHATRGKVCKSLV